VLLLDEQRNGLHFPYVSEDDPEVARRLIGVRIPADAGLAGAVLREGLKINTRTVLSLVSFILGSRML
jgi:hypothetical protein